MDGETNAHQIRVINDDDDDDRDFVVDDLDLDRSSSIENLVTTPNGVPTLRKSDCSSNWCTTPPVYFLLFTNCFMIIMVFILPVICSSHPRKPGEAPTCLVDPFSMLIYSHTIYWFSHLIVDQYLKYHHRRGRLRGYLEFYILTKNIRRTPFYIISFGNAILLVTVTALHDYCDNNSDSSCEDKETKVEVLRGLITLECMVVAFMWVKYVMAVKKFKRDKRPPDLYRADFRRQVLGIKVEDRNAPQCPGREESVDVLQLQSELLIYLCPSIGQEADLLQEVIAQAQRGTS